MGKVLVQRLVEPTDHTDIGNRVAVAIAEQLRATIGECDYMLVRAGHAEHVELDFVRNVEAKAIVVDLNVEAPPAAQAHFDYVVTVRAGDCASQSFTYCDTCGTRFGRALHGQFVSCACGYAEEEPGKARLGAVHISGIEYGSSAVVPEYAAGCIEGFSVRALEDSDMTRFRVAHYLASGLRRLASRIDKREMHLRLRCEIGAGEIGRVGAAYDDRLEGAARAGDFENNSQGDGSNESARGFHFAPSFLRKFAGKTAVLYFPDSAVRGRPKTGDHSITQSLSTLSRKP